MRKIYAEDIAAGEQSFYTRTISSTLSDARCKVSNGTQGSRHVEIVIQGGPYRGNIGTRIGPTLTTYRRAQPRQKVSGRLQHAFVPFKSVPVVMRHQSQTQHHGFAGGQHVS